MSRRELVARLALAIAISALLWSAVLVIYGGFDSRILGIRVRTNDPVRPLLIAFAATFCFIAFAGDETAPGRPPYSVLDSTQRMTNASSSAHTLVSSSKDGFEAAEPQFIRLHSQAELWLNGQFDMSNHGLTGGRGPMPSIRFRRLAIVQERRAQRSSPLIHRGYQC